MGSSLRRFVHLLWNSSSNSVDTMGAPMSSFQVKNPEDAFLTETDGVAVSFWIISIAMIAATVLVFGRHLFMWEAWSPWLLECTTCPCASIGCRSTSRRLSTGTSIGASQYHCR